MTTHLDFHIVVAFLILEQVQLHNNTYVIIAAQFKRNNNFVRKLVLPS